MQKKVAKKIVAWILSICMIAGMVDLSGFTVRAADAEHTIDRIEIEKVYPYTGDQITPVIEDIKVLNLLGNEIELNNAEGEQNYEIKAYGENKNVSTGGTVTIVGKGEYEGEMDGSFTITPKLITDNSITATAKDISVTQAGTNILTEVVLVDGNRNLVGSMNANYGPDVDFTYSFEGNEIGGEGTTDEVEATVKITGCNNYTGSTEAKFKIKRYDASKLKITFSGGSSTFVTGYTGKALEPVPGTHFNVKYDDTVEIPKENYEVSYSNNRNATTEAQVIINVTKGDYRGLSATANFTIRKAFGGNYDSSLQVVGTIKDQPFKGAGKAVEVKPEDVVLIDPDYPSRPLTADQFELGNYRNNTSISTDTSKAYVKVTGQGEYSGSMEVPFNIVAAMLTKEIIHIDDSACIYDGTDQFSKLEVTVGEAGDNYEVNKDFRLERVNNDSYVTAGKHTVRVRAIDGGQLQPGYVDVTFDIASRSLNETGISVGLEPDYPVDGYTYSGSPYTPKLVIQYGNSTLREYTDYNLTYSNNTDASTPTSAATVTATGTGNFTGSVSKTFIIKPQELTRDNITFVGLAETQKFTGSQIEPSFNVRLNNNKNLTRGTDYTVAYRDQVNVGTATIVVSGTGNYIGEVSTTFEIVKRAITDGTRISIPNSMDYTGNQLRPEVSITLNNVPVNPDNYTVAYGGNIEVGTGAGKVIITGRNNYEGETTVSFTINRRNISVGNFLEIKSTDGPDASEYDFINGVLDDRYYQYDGTKKEPALQVSFGGGESGMDSTSLVEGTDYSVEFSSNQDIGTAQATVTGIGNFTGSKTVQFKIKGNLADYNQASGFTKVKTPTQVYTRKPITPKDIEIKFAEYKDPLKLDTDFRIERCEDNIEITDENHKAKAWIAGIGNYYGTIDASEFDIRPLELDKDDLAANDYVIANVEESYIYSGLAEGIKPLPVITHSGDTLLEGANGDYSLAYFQKDAEGTPVVPVDVGNYTVQVTGDGHYYTGSFQRGYEVKPYDISASYAKDKIEIQGVEDVILDAVKDPDAYGYTGTAQMDGDAVIQSGLKVIYTPVAMDGTLGTPRELTEDEFDISYAKDGKPTNTSIGTATVTVTGKGNFEGTISQDFQIRGDLAGENTSITVEDWTYTPERNGQSTNCPQPTVIYTIHRADGTTEELALTDKDYTIVYQGNEHATRGEEKGAAVIISAVEGGNYLNSAEPVPFQVKQRDLSEAVAEDADKLLAVSGLVEEGYEYNGEAQVPELVLSYLGAYAGTELVPGTGNGTYDYEVTAANNVNVYTYGQSSTGEKERLYPEVTVTARKDADGDYVGNYCGTFKLRFQINPREVSEATIQIAGVEESYAYTGDPIRPELAEDAVTWSKGAGTDTAVLAAGTDYTVSYGEAKDNIKIGEGKLTVTAVPESNYAGTVEKTFKIMADLEAGRVSNPPYIILKSKGENEDEYEAPYGAGERVYPDMVFEDWSGVFCGLEEAPKALQKDVDYEIIEEANNTDVGEKDAAYIRLRGKDYYRGEIEIHYTITPMDLSADEENHVTAEFRNSINDEEHQNAYIYTGSELRPEMIIKNRQSIMVPSRDYEIVRYENNTDISTEEAKARVLIRGVEGTNYTGEKWFEFTIIPRSIENMSVTVSSEPQVFSRTEKRPEVQVSYKNETNQTITLTPDDYDIVYTNNIYPATADSGENAPTITITGKDAYSGQITATFTIEPESLEESNEDITITGANVFYTGDPVETEFTVKALDGTVLEENVDFEVGEYSENLSPGTGFAEIKGIGNYTGSRKVAFLIVPPEGDFIIEDIPDQVYTAERIDPGITVSFTGNDITIPVTEGKDYKVEYGEGNTNAGTGTVRVVGLNSFADIDTATKDFTILPKSMGTPDDPDAAMELSVSDQIFTGRGVKPEIQLTFRNGVGSGVALEEGKDYTVNCSGNVAVGIGTATVIGTGNYTGVMQAQFRIVGDLKDAVITEIPIQDYTGQQIRPVPEVTFAGEALAEGVDYTVSYGENIEEGLGSVTITGTSEGTRASSKPYTGTQTVEFEITRDREFTEDTVVVGVAEAYPYTGAPIEPRVARVEYRGEVLAEGEDYTVSYANNINATVAPDHASVIVTGKGRYKGQKVQAFQIRPQQIARATVSQIADQVFNGQEIHPSLQVQAAEAGKALEEGKDYTLVYVNCKTPGKSSIIIRGMGNYTGAQTVSFQIRVPKVAGVKVSGYGSNSLTFSWKANSIVSGYDVYNSSNRPVARAQKGTATSVKANKLKAATTATYRVRAFVIVDGQYYFGEFTSVKGTTAPDKAKIKSAASKKSKQAVIKWGKVSKATGYQVYRSTSKNGSYKKIATTKSASYTDKKLTGGKKYYYRIRVYRKVGSKNYFSDYSTVKSVKVKK